MQELEDQVAELMQYIKRLEAGRSNDLNIESLGAREDSDTIDPVGNSRLGQTEVAYATPVESASTADPDRLPDALDDLSHMMWALDVSDSGETHFRGPSGNFCFLDAKAPRLQGNDTQELADLHVMYMLMNKYLQAHYDSFIKHVNPFFQFLGTAFLLQTPVDANSPLPLQLLYASVIAAGGLFTTDLHASAASRTISAFAESIALECCRHHPSIVVLRALSILSWMNIGLGNDNMGSLFNHMALSMVVHLGLHVISLSELLQREPIDNLTQSSRMEAFWPVFLHDRILTSLLGHNCALPWTRVNVPFIDVATEESSLARDQLAFSFQCQLWDLHDQHMDKIYSFEFGRLDLTSKHRLLVNARDALLGFRKKMTDLIPLRLQNGTAAQKVLHLSYHMSLTLLHRPFLQAEHDRQTRWLALRTTTAAANASSKIIKTLMGSSDGAKLPYFVTHHIMTTALSHLLNATCHDNKTRQKSVNGLRVCLSALETLGGTWSNATAQSLYEIRRLASRWKVVSALPMHLSHPLNEDHPDGSRAAAAGDDVEAFFSANPVDDLFLDQIDMADFFDIVQDGIDIHG